MSNKNHHHSAGRGLSGAAAASGGVSRLTLQRKQYRILDESSRNIRIRRQVEQLERDNFHEEPHSNLVMHKKAPKFEDLHGLNEVNGTSAGNKVVPSVAIRRTTARARKYTLNALIEENSRTTAPNYLTILTRSLSKQPSTPNAVVPSAAAPGTEPVQPKHSNLKLPRIRISSVKRNFCSVCGFKSSYTCVVCGSRYCSSQCRQIHQETRCLKWTSG